MTDPKSIPPQNDPLSPIETADHATAERLRLQRPVPAPGFRGELRRLLVAGEARRGHRLLGDFSVRARATGYLTAGLLLLAVAAVGVAGVGPFAS